MMYEYNGAVYEICNESFEDDYGRWVSNHVVYKTVGTDRKRISPDSYALSSGQAEEYIPKLKHTCPTCNHTTYKNIPLKS